MHTPGLVAEYHPVATPELRQRLSHVQEQLRGATERPKADCSIPRARSGPWQSGTGRRLTRTRATRRRAARERDRAHWLASRKWQPVHAAAWWWWWSFVRRPPSSPTRLCIPDQRATARFELATSSAALWTQRGWRDAQKRHVLVFSGLGRVVRGKPVFFFRGWLPESGGLCDYVRWNFPNA